MDKADHEESEQIREQLEKARIDQLTKHRTRRALTLTAEAANGCTEAELPRKMARALHAQSVLIAGLVTVIPDAIRENITESISEHVNTLHITVSEKEQNKRYDELGKWTKLLMPWFPLIRIGVVFSGIAILFVIVLDRPDCIADMITSIRNALASK